MPKSPLVVRPVHPVYRLVVAGLLMGLGLAQANAQAPTCPALLDRSVPRLQDEQPQSLCQYAGKVVLVVNTASQCGFTPQYKGLEALYERLRGEGLVVLGFPSNDFGGQEPGSASEIAAFCENQFAVKFPMFSKVTVKGAKAHPFYAELAKRSGKTPLWNFHKYLVSRDGQTVHSYTSLTDPDDAALMRDVRAMLSAR